MNTSATASSIFRRKLLGCLALQRLAVMLVAVISTFCSAAFSGFNWYSPNLMIGAAVIQLVLLGCVFLVRASNVAKWFFLLLFRFTEAVLWIGFDTLLHTNIRLFNCSFTLVWTLIVVLFDAIRGRKRIKVHDAAMVNVGGPATSSDTGASNGHVETHTTFSYVRQYFAATSDFLVIHKDGPVAFIITVTVSYVVYAVFMSKYLSAMDFGLSLIFQFVLVSWFTLDLRRLDRHLGLNEASEGVIYVYRDAVVIVGYTAMVSMAFAIASAICVGLATSHGADELRECGVCDEFISCFMCIGRCFTSQCVWCDCELWYDCLYDRYSKRQWCCCDCCQLLLDDSKCLCFSRKHGDSGCCESFYENGRIHADPIVRPNDPKKGELNQVMHRV